MLSGFFITLRNRETLHIEHMGALRSKINNFSAVHQLYLKEKEENHYFFSLCVIIYLTLYICTPLHIKIKIIKR